MLLFCNRKDTLTVEVHMRLYGKHKLVLRAGENTLQLVAEFLIFCEQPDFLFPPFPDSKFGAWGLRNVAVDNGVTCTTRAVVLATNGFTEVRLQK